MIYKSFPKYVLRAPLFSFSFYQKLTQHPIVQEEELKQVCRQKIIKEAVFLASPVLYAEMNKWINGQLKDSSRKEKLVYALLKYISRMSSRCTPFGLFAGTAVGQFADQTGISLKPKEKNNRHTRLDMNYLVALSQDLSKNENIKRQLLFYPNSSLYQAGHQLRYYEYFYVKSKRVHQIVAIENSDYLQKVLMKAQKGALPLQMAETLVDDEVTLEEAIGYVDQLIENQLLISELEPSVSGPEFMDQILMILRKLEGTSAIVSTLEKVQISLDHLDQKIGNDIDSYNNISDELKALDTGFELKYLFQTDMQFQTTHNTLEDEISQKAQRVLKLMNKLSVPNKTSTIGTFQEAFYARYEDKEVTLSKALDVELGIGYLQGQDSGDVSPLIEDIHLPLQQEVVQELPWSPVASILRNKLTHCLINQETLIQLTDDDFKSIEENWNDLPDTISSIVELVTIDGKQKMIMTGSGGPSGGNLLGRFCHADSDIHEFTKQIIEVEQQINHEKILAEIVHLPEARVGNILIRPDFRKYEIPYLAKSILPLDDQIPLEDLMISTRPGQNIKLRSKKLNKEVIPCLTVAHNYSNAALPIYQFLANVRTQGVRPGLGFNWPLSFDEYEYLPRVEYDGVIVSCATWNINTSHLNKLLPSQEPLNTANQALLDFFIHRKIPQYVSLMEGDNELLINTKNTTSIKMLLDAVRRKEKFQLKEFLHSTEGVVKNRGEVYSNQIVISFYNDHKLKSAQNDKG